MTNDERWSKLKKVDWVGVTPVMDFDGDSFFLDEQEVIDYMIDLNLKEMRLLICKRMMPTFQMVDYLFECLPDTSEYNFDHRTFFDDIDKTVNDWIEKNKDILVWESTRFGTLYRMEK